MNPLRRWASGLSRGPFLLVLLGTGAAALLLNAGSRSRVWAYDEAVTPEAKRLEDLDLDRRAARAARAEYVRISGRTLPERMPPGVRDSLAVLEANQRETMTVSLAARRAHLHRMAFLLRAGEALSWVLLAFLVYLAWSHAAGRRPAHSSD
jgi:hypothetical protein